MKIKKIAIVGAGTAGWLAANHLGKSLKNRGISITLIESPDIPTIGVGEGTVPMMRETLKSFGISETEFFRRCDASFKQSIKFVNWLDKYTHGEQNYYHHLFDYPFPNNYDLTPFWLSKQNIPYSEAVSFQSKVCDSLLAPKFKTTAEYHGETTYAYHLNAKSFASLLKENAISKFNVNHKIANVTDVEFDDEGFIKALELDNEATDSYDFYIDCTGFNCFLLGEKLGVEFTCLGNKLPIDTAITAQVPVSNNQEIPPYTIATAHQAGWIWDIGLQTRRGTGFVYSSKHLSHDQARAKFEKYLGLSLDSVMTKRIPMNIGYREHFWKKNCVAIGLSQGFVEPLEATAILVTDFCARHLAERFPHTLSESENRAKTFNRNVKYTWDRVVDFIQLHYYLSDRNDSQFWRDWKNKALLSDDLLEKLDLWRTHPPISTDFSSKFEVFDVENYLYVLYGMRFNTQSPSFNDNDAALADDILAMVDQHAEVLKSKLPSHRELLENINKYPMPKV
ncbi:tryptophan halogenase family protein [Pseudoalteromonas sp. MTN2-4]|uniref:tryptophan halogenase family protein n=1 Tax=Pseudoalteromonas sp. MTN2-4 TaxID=3056555 RepID=UPI0036F244BC